MLVSRKNVPSAAMQNKYGVFSNSFEAVPSRRDSRRGCEPTFCRQGWAWQLELLERKGGYWSSEKGRGFEFCEKPRPLLWL